MSLRRTLTWSSEGSGEGVTISRGLMGGLREAGSSELVFWSIAFLANLDSVENKTQSLWFN